MTRQSNQPVAQWTAILFGVAVTVFSGCGRTNTVTSAKPIVMTVKNMQVLVDERLGQLESANELMARGKEGRLAEALGEIVYDVTPAVIELVRAAAGTPLEEDVLEVQAEADKLAETARRWNRTPAELQSGFNSLQSRLATIAERARAY